MLNVLYMPRQGDWKCFNCLNLVFSHKLQCKCGQHKYTKSAGYLKLTNELYPSFWICVDCNSKWQLDVKKCFKCAKV